MSTGVLTTRLGSVIRRFAAHWLMILVGVLSALGALGCAQAPATNVSQPEVADPAGSEATSVAPSGPVLGTVEVWLAEHGILVWTPNLSAAGTYAFEIENRGVQPHDFIVVRAGTVEAIPVRSDRPLLNNHEVIARSPVLQPDEATSLLVNLDQAGSYVVLSSYGQDFGHGMASVVTVGGRPAARGDPQPTPPPDDRETLAVYLVDDAVFLHRSEVNAGIVTFKVQNIGPAPHDVVVLRWRGDPAALPVDEDGEVLMDSLVVLDQLPPIPGGGEAMLEVELDGEFAYVLLSSLPGDYAAGMSAQIAPQ